MREEFEELLSEYGHDVLLVRASTKVRCSCWDLKRQESPRSCPVCFGLGTVPKVEKHTVRMQDASIPVSYPGMAQQSPIGPIAVPGQFYFFKHDANVSVGDLVLEVEWTDRGKPFYGGGYLSSVNHIDKKRWKNGEVIFKKVYTQDQPVEKEIRAIRISNTNGIINYELTYKGDQK